MSDTESWKKVQKKVKKDKKDKKKKKEIPSRIDERIRDVLLERISLDKNLDYLYFDMFAGPEIYAQDCADLVSDQNYRLFFLGKDTRWNKNHDNRLECVRGAPTKRQKQKYWKNHTQTQMKRMSPKRNGKWQVASSCSEF